MIHDGGLYDLYRNNILDGEIVFKIDGVIDYYIQVYQNDCNNSVLNV